MPFITPSPVIADSAQINPGVIATSDLADNAVTDAKIGAHTTSKITVPTSQLSGTISTSQIGANQVTRAKIETGTQGGVLVHGAAGAVTDTGAGTSGYVLTSNGAGATPTWQTAVPSQLTTTVTAGVSLVAGDPVFLEDSSTYDTSQIISDTATNNDTNQGFGKTTTTSVYGLRAAEKFTTSGAITCDKIIVYLSKAGAPGDSARIGIQADNAGSPSGTYLSSGTVSGGSLTASSAAYTITMAAPISLSASTTYWVVAERTGSTDDTNYYRPSSGIYSGSLYYVQASGGSWSVCSDMKVWHIEIMESSVSGRVYKTKANVAGRYETFLGFSNGTYSPAATATLVVGGVMTGLSGLTVGKVYYLSDTEGAISTTAGSNTRKIGISLSTTSLLLTNIA